MIDRLSTVFLGYFVFLLLLLILFYITFTFYIRHNPLGVFSVQTVQSVFANVGRHSNLVYCANTSDLTRLWKVNPRRRGRTVDLQAGEGLHLALLVGGGAHVGPGVLLGDAGHRQDVEHLETLGREVLTQLEARREKRGEETHSHREWSQRVESGEWVEREWSQQTVRRPGL